jgi:competence protein ComEC
LYIVQAMKRWPLNKAAFWEAAPFFRLLVPLAAGIFAYLSTGLSTVASYGPAVALVLFALYPIAALKKVQGKYTARLTFACAQLFLFTASVSLTCLYDVKNNKSWYGNNINQESVYMARIEEEPREGDASWKLHVQVLRTIHADSTQQRTGGAFVYVYKDALPMLLHKGDTVLLPGAWQPMRNAGNPFEFDYAGYCRRNNIYYRQMCSATNVRLYGAQTEGASPITERMHNWCTAQLNQYIGDAKTKGLIQAMLLGDEANLDPGLRQSFTDTGIVHIIAISGGNITMFFLLISALLWWMKDKRLLWVKYAIALPLVWFYVVMAGASPSAVRAAIMFSLLAVGILLQKSNNNLNQLFATAFLLLCAEPAWLYSLGFQLSFVAVFSLILFYISVYKWWTPRNYILRKLWATAAASIAAEILVAPLVIYYFHSFPLMFLVANVAGYIFMGLVLILGILLIAVSALSPVATAIGTATVWLVHAFDRVLGLLQHFNPDSLQKLTLSVVELALVYVAVAGVAYYLLKRRNSGLIAGLTGLLLLAVLLGIDEWQWQHQRRIIVYNAGKLWTELVEGKVHYVLAGDTTIKKKVEYATRSAHIGWHTQSSGSTSDSVFFIGGKSLVLVRNNPSGQIPRHADYVLMVGDDVDATLMKAVYTPKVVILAGRRDQQGFCEECRQNGIATYEVSQSGAYIIE